MQGTFAMEAYEAKAHIWNIHWQGHEIRFEFLKKTSDSGIPWAFLFFDGKCVAASRKDTIKAQIQADNGKSYLVECETGPKRACNIQWPAKKSCLGRIDDFLDKCLTSNRYIARIAVNNDLIYLSHIGGADTIERVLMQHDLDWLAKEERALEKGKIVLHTLEGYHIRKAPKEELETTRIRLANEKKELESRLSSWKAKQK